MKLRLFAVISCLGIALVWYSLATGRGLAPPQQKTEWVGYTPTFTHSIPVSSYSYLFDEDAAISWGGSCNGGSIAETIVITSPASETKWFTLVVNAPASNLFRLRGFNEEQGTLDETSDSYWFVAYTPVSPTTTSTKVDVNLSRAESGKTCFEPSNDLSTGGNELAFDWTTYDDFVSAGGVHTKPFGSSQHSTNRHRTCCTGDLSLIKELKPSSAGGGSLLAIGTAVYLTPVNPTGG